jgi:hypothetical protein
MTFAAKVIQFNRALLRPTGLPGGVKTMNPFENKEVQNIVELFYSKYYNDDNPRTLILGINLGRLGGGITGIPFTDPERLETDCNIPNNFVKRSEISSIFIHEMMYAFGGLSKFYNQYYFNSICPLGFTLDGKNLNYYDISDLQKALIPYIEANINAQIAMGVNREICYCLGEGKNFKFFQKFNDEHQFFSRVISLPHPRFIMQYKLKMKEEFISTYLQLLQTEK